MQGRIWTVPNQITFLRLGFLPLFLILMSYEKYRWALLVLRSRDYIHSSHMSAEEIVELEEKMLWRPVKSSEQVR